MKIPTATIAAVVLAAGSLAMPTLAQPMDHTKPGMQQALPMTDGEVRKVDKESGKITIKHGEIKNLDMPPMTMVFTASEKPMLDGIAAGDKIQFSATHDKGLILVTDIKVVKP